jgi:hypothetical protein
MIERERESGEDLDMLLSSGSQRCGGGWEGVGVDPAVVEVVQHRGGAEEEQARSVDPTAIDKVVDEAPAWTRRRWRRRGAGVWD